MSYSTHSLQIVPEQGVNHVTGIHRLYLFCNRKGQPYTGNGFRSIWQRKMRSAIEAGVLKERFREHDIRAKAASDITKDHAEELLGHHDGRITDKHYRRKLKIMLPVR